jgi:hypothetical protein
MPHILVLTKSYREEGKQVKVISSTEDLYQWYSSLTKKINNETEKLAEKVKELCAGSKDDEQKLKSIYYWVQDNIKYLAFVDGLAGFQPEDAHKVFYNRYGDCKGMANLLKEMLIIAGFDARLTWVGTNIIPYTYDIPSLAVDNHMICTMFSGGKKYILDPTEKYQPLLAHAERIQGREILIENGEKFIRDKVPVEPINKYLEEKKIIYFLSGNSLTAEGEATYVGESLKNILNRLSLLDKDKIDLFLRNVVSGAGNSNYFTMKSHSAPDRDEALKVQFHGKMDNQLSIFDKDFYLSLDYERDFKDLKIEEKRKSPFDFGRRIFRKTVAELEIPEGFNVQYAPQPLSIKDDHFQFDLRYEINGRKITYFKEIKINKTVIPVSEFEKWNNIVNQLNKFYNDQIILQSII